MKEVYKDALKEKIEDKTIWIYLTDFFKKTDPQKGLAALKQYIKIIKENKLHDWQEYGYSLTMWEGQLYDLLGNRDKAVEYYHEALKTFKNHPGAYFFDIHVTKELIEERLKKPFTK